LKNSVYYFLLVTDRR